MTDYFKCLFSDILLLQTQTLQILFINLSPLFVVLKHILIPYKSPQAVSFQCQGPRTWDLGRWALN